MKKLVLLFVFSFSLCLFGFFISQNLKTESLSATPYIYTWDTFDCQDSRWCNKPSNFPIRTRYVSPSGTGDGSSTSSPMSLQNALAQATAGDLYWLMEGTYNQNIKYGTNYNASGTAASPIVFRAANGKRVVINGRIKLHSSGTVYSNHTWIWGLEVTEPNCLGPEVACNSNADCPSNQLCCLAGCTGVKQNFCYYDRVWLQSNPITCTIGGVSFQFDATGIDIRGVNNRIINTHVHHIVGGSNLNSWSGTQGQVIYGNIAHHGGYPFKSNGWPHGIYTQNNPETDGLKYYINNAMFDNTVNSLSYNFHAYGQEGVVGGMWLEDNIFDNANNQLGGTNLATKEVYVTENVISNGGFLFGYAAPMVSEITNNLFFKGRAEFRHLWGDANFSEADFDYSRRSLSGEYLFTKFTGNTIVRTDPLNKHLVLTTRSYNPDHTKTVPGAPGIARNKSTCDNDGICSDTFANNTYYVYSGGNFNANINADRKDGSQYDTDTSTQGVQPLACTTDSQCSGITNSVCCTGTCTNFPNTCVVLNGSWSNSLPEWQSQTAARSSSPTVPSSSFFDSSGSIVADLPSTPFVKITSNEYDMNRFRVFIGTTTSATTYSFVLGQILDVGDVYSIYDSSEFLFTGEAIASGTLTSESQTVSLPYNTNKVGIFEIIKFNDIESGGGGTCTPSCPANYCGTDGCGGTCSCGSGLSCNTANNQCVECLGDNDCDSGYSCTNNQCVQDQCTPSCTGVSCGGSDGCGGTCTGTSGSCGTGLVCTTGGSCVACFNDTHCSTNLSAPVCDTNVNQCVECMNDLQCGANQQCNLTTNTCSDIVPPPPATDYTYNFNTYGCDDERWCSLANPSRTLYVSPTGSGNGLSESTPMSLTSAVSGMQPGDLYWLMAGNYSIGTPNRVLTIDSNDGTSGSPIIFRGANGQKALIQGSVDILSDHVWLWGVEVTDPGTDASGLSAINGTGSGIKLINNVVHDKYSNSGIAMFNNGSGQLIYGNLIYNSGGSVTSGEPMGIYVQNNAQLYGTKYIINNAIFNNDAIAESRNIYAYGVNGLVTGLHFEKNMLGGPSHSLIGAVNNGSKGITFNDNISANSYVGVGHDAPAIANITNNKLFLSGLTLRMWGAGNYDDATWLKNRKDAGNDYAYSNIQNNQIFAGGTAPYDYHISASTRTYNISGTLEAIGAAPFARSATKCNLAGVCAEIWDNNSYIQKPGGVLPGGSATPYGWENVSVVLNANSIAQSNVGTLATLRSDSAQRSENPGAGNFFGINDQTPGIPSQPWVEIEPNEYDTNRFRIFVGDFNFGSSYELNVSSILTIGDEYALYEADDYLGTPIITEVYSNTDPTVTVPLNTLGYNIYELVILVPGSEIIDVCSCAYANSCGQSAGEGCGYTCTGTQGECDSGLTCTDAGTCVECTESSQCTGNPSGELCDTGTNSCVACLSDTDCSSGFSCNLNNNTCVENTCDPIANCSGQLCGASDGCGGICSGSEYSCTNTSQTCTETGTCVNCITDLQCGEPGTPICKQSVNLCVECTDSLDCSTNPVYSDEPYCNTTNNSCVECLQDSQCGNGTCVNNSCVACTPDCTSSNSCIDGDGCGGTCLGSAGNCTTGQCTTSGTCVECTIDSHCAGGTEPYCKPSTNLCVECLDDSAEYGCPTGFTCNELTNTCIEEEPVECVSNCSSLTCGATDQCGDACVGSSGVCSNNYICTSSGSCVQCMTNAQCLSNELCNTTTNSCYVPQSTPNPTPTCTPSCVNTDGSLKTCGASNGCGGFCTGSSYACTNNLICNATGQCVECTGNADCTGGEVCNFNNYTCVECRVNSDCDTGESCNTSNVCVATPVSKQEEEQEAAEEAEQEEVVTPDTEEEEEEQEEETDVPPTTNQKPPSQNIDLTPTSNEGILGALASIIRSATSSPTGMVLLTVATITLIGGTATILWLLIKFLKKP